MSSFFNKLKAKATTHRKSPSSSSNPEPTFSIQPHPAKTNDPADLNPNPAPQPGGGLQSSQAYQAHHATGPFIPDQQMMASLEQPKTREELHARQAELNK